MQPRKLAAIDAALLGRTLILMEFSAGVILSATLGGFVLWRPRSMAQVALGLYLVSLAMNYVPLLLYAFRFRSREHAREELGSELEDKARAMAKFAGNRSCF